MKLNNQRGFTLIELVLVITVLGILAVAAMPQFINVTATATANSRDFTVGAVREGIQNMIMQDLLAGNNGTPPATLEGANATSILEGVIANGITDSHWTNPSGDGLNYTYTDDTGFPTTYTYTPGLGNGTFLQN